MSDTDLFAANSLGIFSSGSELLANALLNKGTAFTEQERQAFRLTGLIPGRYETIEQQADRAYLQYSSFSEAINKHIYLRMVQDTNETLFYFLLSQHLDEMMPIIYTPTVGDACERFSEIYRRARGLFISYPDRFKIDEILSNVSQPDIKVIVVTDGSRILGLGDQGAGGMGIPIGKLSLYTACGGINPAYSLPIMLDVGTNNRQLLNNPQYIGWQQPRVNEQQYAEFIDLFIEAINKRWPQVLLQFEDFEQQKALPLLQRYSQQICCFNDDIQGTACVALGTLLAGCRAKNQPLSAQTIVFAGAGSAGCGIAEQLILQMQAEGLSEAEARQRIFMVDKNGLLTRDMTDLYDFQRRLAQAPERLADWTLAGNNASLDEVVAMARPTVLIGVSGQPGLFTEAMIRNLHRQCPQPIILPLSNPSKRVEATPEQLLHWTNGQALIASGSPFPAVELKGQLYPIAQCNNSYIFPGIGLAVIAAEITHISDGMLMVASAVLADAAPVHQDPQAALLPPLDDISVLSRKIAYAVGKQAQSEGFAPLTNDATLLEAIEANFWQPRYQHYQPLGS